MDKKKTLGILREQRHVIGSKTLAEMTMNEVYEFTDLDDRIREIEREMDREEERERKRFE